MAQLILWAGVEEESPTLIRSGGVYQVASWIRQHGYSVVVIDFCFQLTANDVIEITNKHIDKDTIAIGVSTTFWQVDKVKRNGRVIGGVTEPNWVKQARISIESKHPSISWIMGGSHAQNQSDFTWHRFTGFSEDLILKWMDEKTSTKIVRPSFDIQSFRKVHHKTDFMLESEVVPIEIGRGCIFKCKFCSTPLLGKRPGTYLRSYDNIRTEIMMNYDEFGFTKYYLTDETVNESPEKMDALAELVKSLPFNFEWVGHCRTDLIWSDFRTADSLRESGLKSPFLGVETFNPVSSKIINKGWSGKHGKEFLLKLKDHWKTDLTWHLGLIYGLPGWTEEEAHNDAEWLIANDMYSWRPWAVYINPLSGTAWQSEFDRNHTQYGYEFDGHDMVNWRHGNITHEQVRVFANKIANKYANMKKIGGFKLGFYSSTLGCSMESLLNKYETDIDQNLLKQKVTDFLDQYKKNHLNS